MNVEEAGTRLAVQDARAARQTSGSARPRVMRVRVDLASSMAGVRSIELKELFADRPGPCAVAFDLIYPDGSMATLRSDQRVRADQELVREVCRLCGDNSVQLEARAGQA